MGNITRMHGIFTNIDPTNIDGLEEDKVKTKKSNRWPFTVNLERKFKCTLVMGIEKGEN